MPSELPGGTADFLVAMLLHEALTKRDVRSARALLGRTRRAPMKLELPATLTTAKDIATAAQAILRAVAAGEVSPADAQRLASVLEHARRAVETEDLERRILELEERAKGKSR